MATTSANLGTSEALNVSAWGSNIKLLMVINTTNAIKNSGKPGDLDMSLWSICSARNYT